MRLVKQYQGNKFSIFAVVLNNGSCPAVEFLEKLKQNNIASHKSLVAVYTRHANYGQILNKTKSRAIKGYGNLFEFKTNQGDRLLYFYLDLSGSKTVLVHGFHKGEPAEKEYRKAKRIRDEYLREIENG